MASKDIDSLAVFRRCRRALVAIFLGVASVSWAFAARCQAAYQGQIVGADDLLKHWAYYLDYSLDIVGQMECLTDNYCDFVPYMDRPNVLWVDIRSLTGSQKRSLAVNCHSFCETTIGGTVGLAMFMAWDVKEIRPSNRLH